MQQECHLAKKGRIDCEPKIVKCRSLGGVYHVKTYVLEFIGLSFVFWTQATASTEDDPCQYAPHRVSARVMVFAAMLGRVSVGTGGWMRPGMDGSTESGDFNASRGHLARKGYLSSRGRVSISVACDPVYSGSSNYPRLRQRRDHDSEEAPCTGHGIGGGDGAADAGDGAAEVGPGCIGKVTLVLNLIRLVR
jgi:hypothetical protein